MCMSLSVGDIKFTYSGVRPLPNSEGKKPGSITRKHIIFDHKQEGVKNLLTLIGGKLTTYRNVGEEIVDDIFKRTNRSRKPCQTDILPLPGCILPSDSRIQEAITKYSPNLPIRVIDHLFAIYGARAVEVLELTINNLSTNRLVLSVKL